MGSSERTLDDVELHHIVLLREDDENFVIAGLKDLLAKTCSSEKLRQSDRRYARNFEPLLTEIPQQIHKGLDIMDTQKFLGLFEEILARKLPRAIPRSLY